jgi:hypothetical protein
MSPPPGTHTWAGYWWGSGCLSRSMTIPRQLSLGEVIGQKEGKAQPKPRPVSPSLPRRELDVELLRGLLDIATSTRGLLGNIQG